MEFEWNTQKAADNLRKHAVSFEEAVTIFHDVLSYTYYDREHSHDEQRYVTIGVSAQGRLLVVAHTIKGEQIRIISARAATRREKTAYEKENG